MIWLAHVSVGESDEYTYQESPNCLANHEAKALAQQLEQEKLLTEEKYKEMQVG